MRLGARLYRLMPKYRFSLTPSREALDDISLPYRHTLFPTYHQLRDFCALLRADFFRRLLAPLEAHGQSSSASPVQATLSLRRRLSLAHHSTPPITPRLEQYVKRRDA